MQLRGVGRNVIVGKGWERRIGINVFQLSFMVLKWVREAGISEP